ncbi:MAG: hypothetical protein JXR91_02260 [Deltaproteobacteria bacterium]|nr:hypothetical protein [Deltaproteobacteria bacterium]
MKKILLTLFIILEFTFAFSLSLSAKQLEINTLSNFSNSRFGTCIIYYKNKNRNIQTVLAPTCQTRLDIIYNQLGTTPDSAKPIKIIVVESPNDFGSFASDKIIPKWSGAVTFPEERLILLSLNTKNGSPNTELPVILAHELSHMAFRQAAGTPDTPRWFTEGVAIMQSEGSSFQRRTSIWWTAIFKTLLPLSEINKYPLSSLKAEQAYAQGAGFTEFLINKYGWNKVRELISLINTNQLKPVDFSTAFFKSFGKPVKELEQEWRKQFYGDKGWLVKITDSAVFLGFAALLSIFAYIMVQKRKKIRLQEMEKEEEPIDNLINSIDEMIETKDKENNPDPKNEIEVNGEKYTIQ